LPITVVTRGKATICPQVLIDDGKASAGDHDFHCVNFTTSVILIMDINATSPTSEVKEVLQSFYRSACDHEYVFRSIKCAFEFVAYLRLAHVGIVNVTLKDSIFQASSPLRHMH